MSVLNLVEDSSNNMSSIEENIDDSSMMGGKKSKKTNNTNLNPRERKALLNLMKAWEFELQRTYEHRPSPCFPINPFIPFFLGCTL